MTGFRDRVDPVGAAAASSNLMVSAREIAVDGPWGPTDGPIDLDIPEGGVTIIKAPSGRGPLQRTSVSNGLGAIRVATLAITALSARRDRQFTMGRLYPPIEV